VNARTITIFVVLLVIIAAAVWYASQQEMAGPPALPIGAAVTIEAPLGLPPVPFPEDNPPTAETIALGRRLYFDPALSVDDTVSCATCHHPDFGFADGQSVSTGVGGQKGGRNSPTVFNSAYYTLQFWDGRSPSLEDQAAGPVQNPIEMGHTLLGVELRLSTDQSYVAMFEAAFGPGPITYEKTGKAIATFERTVISGNSPFDRWRYGGEEDAVSQNVKNGFEVFQNPEKGNCAVCHEAGEEYALFTDNKFHNLGVGAQRDGTLADIGRFEVTQVESDQGAFKTPSLRNIALTAPYMHDGSLRTLKEVIDFYLGGGNSNDHLDAEINVLGHLSGQERDDLLAFLESLTGEIPPNIGAIDAPEGSEE
jgi:cytochrome c peroxidase